MPWTGLPAGADTFGNLSRKDTTVIMRKTLVGGLTAMLSAGGFAVLPALPAAAGVTPQCTKAIDHLPDGPSGGVWVPAASTNARLCFMQQYNYSDGVWALQRALRYCYGENIAIDKDFGPATKSALSRVQGKIGAFPDGKYGPETAKKLKFSSINTDAAWACSIQTF
ncbi:peptidoglycan-binding protein [Kribbella sp. NBC_01245]|uniref:peptidoglycan-binding domain-containing protein n=1 Tax=Kribbella sp. NBC_01245 TaxID=2903578 RepID=UPI002E2ADB77|nr:peptidoglycan-binding domain-containing protein [Kribbella sp. NBC_01245]